MRNQPSLFSSVSVHVVNCLLCTTLGPDQNCNPSCHPRGLYGTYISIWLFLTRLWVHLRNPAFTAEPSIRRCSNIHSFIYFVLHKRLLNLPLAIGRDMEGKKGKKFKDINPSFNYFATGQGLHSLLNPPAPNTKLWKNFSELHLPEMGRRRTGSPRNGLQRSSLGT